MNTNELENFSHPKGKSADPSSFLTENNWSYSWAERFINGRKKRGETSIFFQFIIILSLHDIADVYDVLPFSHLSLSLLLIERENYEMK